MTDAETFPFRAYNFTEPTGLLGWVWDFCLDKGVCGFLTDMVASCVDTNTSVICAEISDEIVDLEEDLKAIEICGHDW